MQSTLEVMVIRVERGREFGGFAETSATAKLRLYGERVAVIFDYTHHPDVHASRSGVWGILENGIVMAFIQSQREMVATYS